MVRLSSIIGAIALSGSFVGGLPVAEAATHVVSTCADAGAGSLRDAVARAATGDTIDARGLRCGTVLLARRIEVPQPNLAILGPGIARLAIDANFADRLFLHAGGGVLRLNGITLARGREFAQEALGGCIRSAGSVTLESVHMHYCQAEGMRPDDDEPLGTSATAAGGGVYAAGNVRMVDSEIHDGSASTITGWGGGVAAGTLTMYRSRLRANAAEDGAGAYVFGFHATQSLVDHNAGARSGGVHVWGDAFVLRSTIADNTGADYCGGLCVQGHARIVDSTLSRNVSGIASAAAFSGDVEIFNSTIADNRVYGGPSGCRAVLARLDTPYRLHIESSIVAANRCTNGGAAMDIEIAFDEGGADSVSGASNLIGTANGTLPADTIHSNPRLSSLAANGGPTPTMRTASDSPALDRGANPLGLSTDQRGAGFPRTTGTRSDIGAYER